MGSITWFYVYDQLKISQLLWKSCSRAVSYHFRVQAKKHLLTEQLFHETVTRWDDKVHSRKHPGSFLFWWSFLLWLRAAWGYYSHPTPVRSEQGRQTSAALADLLWSQPRCFVPLALTVPPPHENTRTEFCQSLGSKATQKKAVVAVSEQRKSITEWYLAVGWGFLVQARYSCHPKSGDSYMLAKICLGKNPKSQNKN